MVTNTDYMKTIQRKQGVYSQLYVFNHSVFAIRAQETPKSIICKYFLANYPDKTYNMAD